MSNIEVENYLLSVLLINQVERNQKDDTDASNLVLQVSIPPRAMEFDRTASVSSTSSNPATPRRHHKPLCNQPSSASAASAASTGSVDSGLGGDTVQQQQPPPKAATNGGSPEANRKGKGTASKFFRKFSKRGGLLSHKNSKASKGTTERKRTTQSESNASPDIATKGIELDSVTDGPEHAEMETSEGHSSPGPVASDRSIESDVSSTTPKGSPDLSLDRKTSSTGSSSSPQLTRNEDTQSPSESPEQVRKLTAENGISSLPQLTEGIPASPIGSSRWSRKAIKKASPKLTQKVLPKEKPKSPPSSPTLELPFFDREERAKSPVDGTAEAPSGDGIELTDIIVEEKRETSMSPTPSGLEPSIDWEAVGEDSRTLTPVQAGEDHFRTTTPEDASSPELSDRRVGSLELNWEHFQNSQEIQARRVSGDFQTSFSQFHTKGGPGGG